MLIVCAASPICADINVSLSWYDSCAFFYTACMLKILFKLMQVDFSAVHLEASENIPLEVNECVRGSRMWVCLSDVNFLF